MRTKNKAKILKASKKKLYITQMKNKIKTLFEQQQISHGAPWRAEGSVTHFSSAEKLLTVNSIQ